MKIDISSFNWVITFSIIVIVSYFLHYLKYKCKRLNLFYAKTEKNLKIVNGSRYLSQEIYYPTFYLCTGILQTIAYGIWRAIRPGYKGIKFISQEVALSDGGEIVLDWPDISNSSDLKDDSVIIAILPGLTGGTKDNYVRDIIFNSLKNNYRPVVLNHRGCSNHKLKTSHFYCGSSSNDCEAGLNAIHDKFPKAKIYLIGFSLGANIGVNYITENPSQTLVKGLISVSNPYDFLICDLIISQYLCGIFHLVLGLHLCSLLRKHLKEMRGIEGKLGHTLEEGISKVWTSRDFDDIFTSRAFNYTNAFDYYRKASCVQNIIKVNIPMFFLSAEDDPMVHKVVIPFKECIANPLVILATHPTGGHCSYYRGIIPKSWFYLPCFDFINQVERVY